MKSSLNRKCFFKFLFFSFLIAAFACAPLRGQDFSQFRWKSLGLAASGGMWSICVHPRDENTLWAVADMGGGVYYTADGGRSWTDVTENLIRGIRQTGFNLVFVQPSGRVFVTSRGGIANSTDSGKTWKLCGGKIPGYINWMAFHPDIPEIIGCADNNGAVYLSKDAGETWAKVFSPSRQSGRKEPRDTSKVHIIPGGQAAEYLLYKSYYPAGMALSRDQGQTWENISSGLPHSNVVDIACFQDRETGAVTLYCLLDGRATGQGRGWTGGFYASHDYGKTWQAKNNGIYSDLPPEYLGKHLPFFNSMAAAQKRPGLIYLAGGNINEKTLAILRTEDGGGEWTLLEPEYVNINIGGFPDKLSLVAYDNMLALSQSNPDIFYFTHSPVLRFEQKGRIVRQIEYDVLTDQPRDYRWQGGSHVSARNVLADPQNNYIHTISHDVGYGRIDPDTGIVKYYHSGKIPWSQGNAMAIDPRNPGTLYVGGSASSVWKDDVKEGGIFKSADYGETFWSTYEHPESGLPWGYIFDIEMDLKSPPESRTIYASIGGYGIYRSDDSGRSWQAVNNNLPLTSGDQREKSNIRRIHIDDKGGIYAVMYAGGSWEFRNSSSNFPQNRIFYSQDKGRSWTETIAMNNFGGVIFDLITEPGNPAIIYTAGLKGVFQSADQGSHWTKLLDNTEQNIKDLSAPYRLAVHPKKPERLWVMFYTGMRGYDQWGVWASADRGRTWQEANNGLAFSRLTDISIDYKNPDIVYVATQGSGCFRGEFGGRPARVEPAVWQDRPFTGTIARLNRDFGMPRRIKAIFTGERIVFDGEFKEQVWNKCEKADGFISYYFPKTNAVHQTCFSVCYDASNIYFRVRCEQPDAENLTKIYPLEPLKREAYPAYIHASLEDSLDAGGYKHDSRAWVYPGIEIFLETKGYKAPCVSQFIAACNGMKFDCRTFGEIGAGEWNADPMWEAKPFIHKDYYEILFRIPFKAVNLELPRPGDKVRVKVCRNRDHSSWTPIGFMSSLADFGELVFSGD